MQQSTAVGVAWWVGTQSAFAQSRSPLERLNFACIGVEGKGSSDTDDAGGHGNVVAVCDIDDLRLQKKATRFPNAKKYHDYRKMLEEMEKDIDAVTVSTPDHSHAPASVMAMRMGKHCFCQKPLTWSVHEARVMRELAKEKKLATQMGNQGTANGALREAVEIVKAGLIGDVKEAHVWTNRPIWPQGTGRPTDMPEVPAHIHWDLFLGPAPYRPYHSKYHPFAWRGWLDFGTGALGDMACHTMNMPVMALDLFDPIAVTAESSGVVENETYPKWSVIEYEFPERGSMPPVKLTWYDGGKTPPAELLLGKAQMSSRGALLVGEKATIYSDDDYCGGYKILSKDPSFELQKPEPSLPRSPGHFKEFAIACAGGEPAMSNFDYAARLTETVLLGNLAMRAGQRVEWDAKNLKVTNVADANQFVKREYREGWTL
jgi:predicted dehydrogenase